MDAIFLGAGNVRPRVSQPAVATCKLLLLLLLLYSLCLPLEGTSLAGSDLLDDSFPSRVLLKFLLLTCCRRDGQTWNTELLTIMANETWRLRIILWPLDYRLLTGDFYCRNKRHYTSKQFIVSATECRFCSEI